jgi:hypothetical protein
MRTNGRPVVDMIRKARLPVSALAPVVITSGSTFTTSGGYYHVPKRDLVGAVQSVLQGHRLKVAKELKEARTLVKELQAFRAKITTTANEKFENDWRIAPHDDLVLALALAVWMPERKRDPHQVIEILLRYGPWSR